MLSIQVLVVRAFVRFLHSMLDNGKNQINMERIMSFSQQRMNLCNGFSTQLATFDSALTDMVQCPLCLKNFPKVSWDTEITAAHIIPAAAGGTRITILCNPCNSTLGAAQDRWFGEYLALLLNPQASAIDAKTKSRYIEVNGKKVRGIIRSGKNHSIDVIIPTNHNPPGTMESLTLGSALEVTFTADVFKHEHEISMGYVTAAYLMWFNAIGYSWTYQSHLNATRNRLMNLRTDVRTGIYIVDLNQEPLVQPAVCVVPWRGNSHPGCVIYDRLVVFPALTENGAISWNRNKDDSKDVRFTVIDTKNRLPPHLVTYGRNTVVRPDMHVTEPRFVWKSLYIPTDESQGLQLID